MKLLSETIGALIEAVGIGCQRTVLVNAGHEGRVFLALSVLRRRPARPSMKGGLRRPHGAATQDAARWPRTIWMDDSR